MRTRSNKPKRKKNVREFVRDVNRRKEITLFIMFKFTMYIRFIILYVKQT